MEHVLQKLTDDIYYLPASHETDRPLLAVIVGKERSLVVDAGNSEKHGELFLQALTQQGLAKPDYLAITHWHWDHVFGIKTMGLPTFAHVETQRKVNEMVNFDWSDEALDARVAEGLEIPFCSEMIKAELPMRENLQLASPNISFTTKVEIDLGGIHCIIEHVGGDHSIDSSVIYVPERKVLFLGDCLSPDIYSGEWSYSVQKSSALVKKLQSYQADYYVESHNIPVAKEDMEKEFQLMQYFIQSVIKYQKDLQAITEEFELTFQRSFTEDELGFIHLFIAGLSKSACE